MMSLAVWTNHVQEEEDEQLLDAAPLVHLKENRYCCSIAKTNTKR